MSETPHILFILHRGRLSWQTSDGESGSQPWHGWPWPGNHVEAVEIMTHVTSNVVDRYHTSEVVDARSWTLDEIGVKATPIKPSNG